MSVRRQTFVHDKCSRARYGIEEIGLFERAHAVNGWPKSGRLTQVDAERRASLDTSWNKLERSALTSLDDPTRAG